MKFANGESQNNSSLASLRSLPFEVHQRSCTCSLDGDEVDAIIEGLTFSTLGIVHGTEVPKKSYQIEALQQIMGSKEEATQSLPDLLKNSFGMDLDCQIDVSGSTEGGFPLGVKGYIAHNDKTIVLSYKLKNSTMQFLEEMDSTSTEWIVKEKETTTSSFFLDLLSLCGGSGGNNVKPSVHTSFYHNFMATLPDIKTHIDPLLAPDQPQRSLFVVGQSVGAGVASLASYYFLLEYDWSQMAHKFVSVLAGSPRSCSEHMRALLEERSKELGDSVRLYRVVQEDDIVPLMPASTFGFQHVFPSVTIDEHGNIGKQGSLPNGCSLVTEDTSSFITNTENEVGGSTASGIATADGLSSLDGEQEAPPPSDNKIVTTASDITDIDQVSLQRPKILRSHTHTTYLQPFLHIKGVDTVAELRLQAMPPFSALPIKVAPREEVKTKKKNTAIPGSPKIKTKTPMKLARPQSSWWKPKVRKPTGTATSALAAKKVNEKVKKNKIHQPQQQKTMKSPPVPAEDRAIGSQPVTKVPVRKNQAYEKRRNAEKGL